MVLDAVAPGQGGQPRRGLLLRPGDGRRGPRHVRAARASRSSCATSRPAPRTSSPRTSSSSSSSPAATTTQRRRACWPRPTPCATTGPRTVLVTSVLPATTPEDSHRRGGRLRRRRLVGRHAAAADHAERRGDVDRRALPRAHPDRRLRRGRAGAGPPRPSSPSWRRRIAAGTREIQLVAAQDAIADPPARFARDPAALRSRQPSTAPDAARRGRGAAGLRLSGRTGRCGRVGFGAQG